jgi:hypothetical protein
MKAISTLLLLIITTVTFAQVGINNETPDVSSALDITSTTSGILIPRMTKSQRVGISSPSTGLMVSNHDTKWILFL